MEQNTLSFGIDKEEDYVDPLNSFFLVPMQGFYVIGLLKLNDSSGIL